MLNVLKIVGLEQFMKEQPNGLDTGLKPEGKQISYTLSKKIILARAIIKRPRVIILEDALDQFNIEETKKIIAYLTDPKQPWTLIVVSSNKEWETQCSEIITLDKGKIINKK